jgi:hypothetical protein
VKTYGDKNCVRIMGCAVRGVESEEEILTRCWDGIGKEEEKREGDGKREGQGSGKEKWE